MRFFVGMLAVLKIHAAYVPLDAGYPPDRLSYIIADADVSMVLTLSHLSDRLTDVIAPVSCLDQEDAQIAAFDEARLS